MRVLVDTTYLLPTAGIAVEGVEKDLLKRAPAGAHEVNPSDISLFEIPAKGAKPSSERLAAEERVALAIQSILDDERITKVSAYREEVARNEGVMKFVRASNPKFRIFPLKAMPLG
ncbi:MAG: hypothetical protein KGI38_11130 [Thaumarchaeota archaeon]|nr:hypothetical protein [Nitrososphaerota archaeon]